MYFTKIFVLSTVTEVYKSNNILLIEGNLQPERIFDPIISQKLLSLKTKITIRWPSEVRSSTDEQEISSEINIFQLQSVKASRNQKIIDEALENDP